VLDDILFYHLRETSGAAYWLVVANAGNRAKIVDWLSQHLAGAGDVQLSDTTHRTAMIAVQGPAALGVAAALLDDDPSALKYYCGIPSRLGSHEVFVSRTGYTGEDGCELIVPAESAEDVWTALLSQGEAVGAMAAGLGARDTLRLEAAMPLYGHELTEQIDPFQAGLEFAVNLDGRQFPGRDALARIQVEPKRLRRVGLALAGRRVPREGYAVTASGENVGEITSGTFSPTLEQPIAMGYIPPQFASDGTEVEVDIRGRAEPARVVPLPFYRRKGN
jgi:aminomethyltransferase